MKNILLKLNKKNTGFTLVETLVSLSIFSVSVILFMSVLGSGITDTNYAKQKIVAGYLAQEGIEYMRNMRDNNVLYDPMGPQH
ncbi:MAG: type II secretion system protein, partial [Patescibacteria group bacterium]